MNNSLKKFTQRLVTAVALIILLALFYFALPTWMLSLGLALLCMLLLVTEWPTVGIWWLTPIYPITPFVLLIILNQTNLYHHLTLFVIALSSSFDTGAYMIGSLIGRHTITPRISPKKTWEGLAGGFLITYGTSFLLLNFYSLHFSALFLALVISAAAFTGDLFASWLKRKAGIKDSGSLLPGHGGLLDRFDSILFVTVVIYLLRDHLSA